MGKFTLKSPGDTCVVEGADNVQMVMLVRRTKEYFCDFIEKQAKAQCLKVVVNGSFIDLSFGSRIAVMASSAAVDPAESLPIGKVVQDGKMLAGSDSPGKFNFSQDTCGSQKFSASLGNPSLASCSAIGGIAPIFIAGMPYGAHNLYKAGVPAGAPLIGDVDAKFRPFLIQKSNAMFAALLARGGDVGKTAIGFSRIRQKLLLLVQANGKAGADADGVRGSFANNNVDNAVFLDCSDSATLYYDGKFLVRPGARKNEFLTVAVGFK